MNEQRAEPRNVTMYPDQWAIVDAYATEQGFTVSLALRQIVKKWARDKELVDAAVPYTYRMGP